MQRDDDVVARAAAAVAEAWTQSFAQLQQAVQEMADQLRRKEAAGGAISPGAAMQDAAGLPPPAPTPAPRVAFAFGKETRDRVLAGDQAALFMALAATAAQWLDAAGYSHRMNLPSAVQCVALPARQAAFVAAALDLVAVLRLSAQGRKALSDLRFQPLGEQAEAP